VRYDKKTVGDAPGIDTDGELAATDEAGVFDHYGIAAETSAGRRLARR